MASAANQRHDASADSLSFTEPLYLSVGAQGNAAGAGNLAFRFKFPLSEIKNTIFELDKVIYAGEVLILRIVFEGTNKIAYAGTNAANPTTGATAYPIAAQTPIVGFPLQLNNLTLYLAVERNDAVVSLLRSKVMSGGFNILIPYTTGYSIALTGGTQTISLRFNRGNGRRLVEVYTTSFDPTEATNLAYDNSNIASAGILNFYTMLDNRRLQEFDLDCSDGDDYMLLEKKLAGSVIQNMNIYNYNFR